MKYFDSDNGFTGQKGERGEGWRVRERERVRVSVCVFVVLLKGALG